MLPKKRIVIVVLFILLVFVLITESNKLFQLNNTWKEKTIAIETRLKDEFTVNNLSNGFELVEKYPEKSTYTNLYLQLSQFESAITAIIELHKEKIENKIGKDSFYDEQGGTLLFGAAPIVLLNSEKLQISPQAINDIKSAWSDFINNTRLYLFNSPPSDPSDLAYEYFKLVKKIRSLEKSFGQ